MKHVIDRDIEVLSGKNFPYLNLTYLHFTQLSLTYLLKGGELQRFAIGIVIVQKADVYMFDEPSSYLDVKQRLKAATSIRSLVADNAFGQKAYVLVVEHDLAILDYLSDYICCLYGTPSAYGVVTMPFSVREGMYQPYICKIC